MLRRQSKARTQVVLMMLTLQQLEMQAHLMKQVAKLNYLVCEMILVHMMWTKPLAVQGGRNRRGCDNGMHNQQEYCTFDDADHVLQAFSHDAKVAMRLFANFTHLYAEMANDK
jgi:hypothetical protein